ncbi:aspartate/glutamate racemase family protein [Pectobacterium sp. B1J-3]|uniref:aspartate/glutamate racemase family protein n=1 Tax=Pectobacterium sp. B1J-3 TaxID=3385371 RepID=UPI0039060D8C
MKGLIGVLGGMGPAATVDLFSKFIKHTDAVRDQDHIPLIISSIPDIPDRTTALMNNGQSPLPILRDYLHKLEDFGAECIIIPCNTAHYWFQALKDICHIEILSIVETTMASVAASGKKRIGLLATDATLYMGLYQKAIENLGLSCIQPELESQKKIMESIYALKSGDKSKAKSLLHEQVESLFHLGAEVIILGCTEIPLILSKEIEKDPNLYIDSTDTLVCESIKWYEKRTKKTKRLIKQR